MLPGFTGTKRVEQLQQGQEPMRTRSFKCVNRARALVQMDFSQLRIAAGQHMMTCSSGMRTGTGHACQAHSSSDTNA